MIIDTKTFMDRNGMSMFFSHGFELPGNIGFRLGFNLRFSTFYLEKILVRSFEDMEKIAIEEIIEKDMMAKEGVTK